MLVIFLLLSSGLVFTPGVPIQLPEARELPGTANRTVVVAVDETGQLYFQNQVIDAERLKVRLQNAIATVAQPVTLVVQADKKVALEDLMPLWVLARSLGIKEIIQATRPAVVPAAVSPKT